ncbi:MAG: DUF4430 domain-containing protein [Oscillospiraceae bacterium]|nr:DUF4430 domain-containing protein [Oscillospiraceae bacterium]
MWSETSFVFGFTPTLTSEQYITGLTTAGNKAKDADKGTFTFNFSKYKSKTSASNYATAVAIGSNNATLTLNDTKTDVTCAIRLRVCYTRPSGGDLLPFESWTVTVDGTTLNNSLVGDYSSSSSNAGVESTTDGTSGNVYLYAGADTYGDEYADIVINVSKPSDVPSISLTANFATQSGVTVATVSADTDMGSVSSPIESTNDSWTLTATPNAGYMLEYWTKSGSETHVHVGEASFTETITENTTYTAYFKTAQVILLDNGARITPLHVGVSGVTVANYKNLDAENVYLSGNALPTSENVNEDTSAELYFDYTVPSDVKGLAGSDNVNITLYKGNSTETEDIFATAWTDYFSFLNFRAREMMQIYVPSMPYATGFTAKVTIGDGVPTIKYYDLGGYVIADTLKTNRAAAIAELDTKLAWCKTQDNYTSDNEVQGLVHSIYNTAVLAIGAVALSDEGAAQITSLQTTAIAALDALINSGNVGDAITVAVSVEKLIDGGRYVIEPTLIVIPNGSYAMGALKSILEWRFPESEIGMKPYLSTPNYDNPAYISAIYDPQSGGYTSESGAGGGWMYAVNNDFPNVGANQTVLRDGDVMRWQLTSNLGNDIKGTNQPADKDALLWVVAEINRAGNAVAYGAAYTDAVAVLTTLLSTQEQVDDALAALGVTPGGSDGHDEEPPGEPATPIPYTTALANALTYLGATVTNPINYTVGGEWAVLALARSGVITDEATAAYLSNLLTAAPNTGAVKLHAEKSTENSRVVLALTALGYDAADFDGRDFVSALSDTTYDGNQGVNGTTFALIALNSKPYSGNDGVKSALVSALLAEQNADGGWGLVAGESTADITAMALQALAPYYSAKSTEIDEAVNWLKSQTVTDSEGNVQIIVALSALGQDAASYVETLLTFRDATTGGFRHVLNGAVDGMATEQAAYALVAYSRFLNEQTALYDMSDVLPAEPIVTNPTDKTALNTVIAAANALSSADYTTNSWNNLQTVLASAVAYNNSASATQSQVDGSVTAINTAIANLVPKSTGGGGTTNKYVSLKVADPQGVTYFSGQIELESDDNAYSILLKAGLTVRTANGGQYGGLYIESINGLAEFDQGSGSGWMYSVGGVFPEYSASLYALTGGETVNWLYTRDLGEDLKNYGSGSVQVTGGSSGSTNETTSVAGKLKVTTTTDDVTNKVTETVAEISAAAVKELSAEKDAVLTVQTELATVTLDNATLVGLVKGVADDETIRVDVKVVSGADAEIEVSVTVGNTAVHDFAGAVTVSVPYTTPATLNAEDYDLITVYYRDDEGELTEIKGATYDPKTGLLTFATSHFSTFVLREWLNPFGDVARDSWYYKAVRYGYSNDLVNGVGDGKFAPQDNLTRAQLVTILARQSGVDTTGGATWYEQALIWGKASGITDGAEPEANITREQVAAMLYRYAKVGADGWGGEAMAWAQSAGILNDGRPSDTATRAEIVTILERYFEELDK